MKRSELYEPMGCSNCPMTFDSYTDFCAHICLEKGGE